MLKRTSKLAFGILILAVCLYSCKSLQGTGSSAMVSVDSPDVFTSRLKLTLPKEGKKKQKLNGSVRMVRDKFIQISIVAPVLRTEAVRIEVSPTEMLLIDRINSRYSITPAAEIKRLLGPDMDYNRLQNILSEAVFVENATGWNMRQENVKIDIPVSTESGTQKVRFELNRIVVPGEEPSPTKPSSRYERKELTEILEGIVD